MKNLIFFDDDNWKALLPLTYTKPICELRLGIFTIKERWERVLEGVGSYITQDYLAQKYSVNITEDNYLINSTLLPTKKLCNYIKDLNINEALVYNDELVVARISKDQLNDINSIGESGSLNGIDVSDQTDLIQNITRPYHLFSLNNDAISYDFDLIVKGRKSQTIPNSCQIIGDESKIFIEKGAKVYCSSINVTEGPVYIGKDTEIMEGSLLRGPLAVCDHSTIKMGAKIYGGTTIGPQCKVGGEVGNSVLQGNSNKGHEGYLGNSVIGEWCNLGADTNTSNLKNNYAEVKLWSYESERFDKTGLQFCGLIMGDHAKCGINTMFNTGTTVGVSANIFGDGYPRNFIPSFSWGGSSGFKTYNFDAVIDVAKTVMARRKTEITELDIKILKYIFLHSAIFRSWEK
jgi:UDP-N-acetylglucosamine diphosphorylase/glucosamine-1-phosphate N-acetyltransferase